jgi:hypothetical protein
MNNRSGTIPLYVHSPNDGPVQGEFLKQIEGGVNDIEFLKRFQKGLSESLIFRDHHITHGNFGEVGKHEDVIAGTTLCQLGHRPQPTCNTNGLGS